MTGAVDNPAARPGKFSLVHLATIGTLEDGKSLLNAGRFDGANYVCGYAVEIGLKARICRTLKWAGFPNNPKEFSDYRSFQTHKLDILLHLSGKEDQIKENYFPDWNVVAAWETESRYALVGTMTQAKAQKMITAAEALLEALRKT